MSTFWKHNNSIVPAAEMAAAVEDERVVLVGNAFDAAASFGPLGPFRGSNKKYWHEVPM